jgi:3'-phosphoadenosine 5'-phosphosulfate sulfotransferase (PAPS reductase)/FAD synthetase
MDIEKMAFERLRLGAETSKRMYNAPLLLCYSGGKDSDVLLQLAINSGIDFEVLHNHTTIDAPETVYHIRNTFKKLELQGIKCTIEKPTYKGERVTMWSLIPMKMFPPTRIVRYCCTVLKERGGRNRAIATGVRRAESIARSKRGIYEDYNSDKKKKIILNNDNDDKRRWFERCQKQAKTIINPIVDWNDENIKDYIQSEKIDLNPLYCEGFRRVGCVGCPMAGKHRYVEFRRYPTYKKAYIHAFDRMLSARIANEKDKTKWQTGYDVFRWWLEEDYRQYEIGEEFYQSEE